MTENIKRASAILEELKSEHSALFRNRLKQVWDVPFGGTVVPLHSPVPDALKALQKSARTLLDQSVDRMTALTPEVFVLIKTTVSDHLTTLARSIEVYSQFHPPKTEVLQDARFDDIRRAVDEWLEGYRSHFADQACVADERPASAAGRKPDYDWPAALDAIWGRILRGELFPKRQADIERALLDHFEQKLGRSPGESSARPYAKRIWGAYQAEA